jgi:hypothetical protein
LSLVVCDAQSRAAKRTVKRTVKRTAKKNKNQNKNLDAHTISATDIGNSAHFPPQKTNSKPDNLILSKNSFS